MQEQYSQKYSVVCFFDQQKTASSFPASEWPLHVTILDTFKTEWQLSTLSKELKEAAANVAPFDTVPIEAAMLGQDKDVSVKLLLIKGAMSALHNELMSLVDKGSIIFNTPEFVGNGFLPHATDQEFSQVAVGRAYRLGSISLVDMFPNNDHTRRQVVDTYSFNREL